MNDKKILLIDLETAPNISYTWGGTWEVDVVRFKEEGYIMSFAYKWLGEKNVHAYSLQDFKKGDAKKQLVLKLHELFDSAEVICAQNGDGFDIKMANRSFVYYKLDPPSPYKTIDTLKIAKNKFKFTSNKLDNLGEYLGLGRKVETGGFDLWLGCMAGNKSAWKKMIQYNKNDVILLEKVYMRLRPYMTNHPNINVEDSLLCPTCGSDKLQNRGWIVNIGFKRKRFQCRSCGRWCAGRNQRIISQENLLKQV